LKIAKAKEKFLEACSEAKRTDWTLRNYYSTLNRLANAFPDVEVEDLTTDAIEDWLKSLEVSRVARQQYKLRLRPFFKWLIARGLVPCNPIDGIIMPLIEQHKIAENEWLTFDECERLLNACENWGQRATILVGIRSGCRRETLISPTTKFDLEKCELTTFEKRHRDGIKYYYDGETAAALKHYFGNGGKWPFAKYNGINVELAQLSRVVGIKKKVTAKMLRHTFACHSRLKGMRREDLQRLMHHANPQTTAIYDDVGPMFEKETYKKIWDSGRGGKSPDHPDVCVNEGQKSILFFS
jgi:site-specific recombinase XerD